jgi:hypothetical protein
MDVWMDDDIVEWQKEEPRGHLPITCGESL